MNGSADVLVVGGGPAGAAAATRLAAGGLRVVLCERQAETRPQVCGEFLSAAAIEELDQLGVVPSQFGAPRIGRTRVVTESAEIGTRLPRPGYGFSRTRLDQILIERARVRGAEVRTGTSVRRLQPTDGIWSATLADGSILESGVVLLATGKHDLRGYARSGGSAPPTIGFKMHYRLPAGQAAALGDAVELFLYDGGYAGLQKVEGEAANLCLIMRAPGGGGERDAWSATIARLQHAVPALRARLDGAVPVWPKPASVARVPYGYLCTAAGATDGLYRVGDQAAVIPSLAGEGIAIALRSARLTADAVLRGRTAKQAAAAIHRDVAGPLRRAAVIEAMMRRRPLRHLVAVSGALPVFARLMDTGFTVSSFPFLARGR